MIFLLETVLLITCQGSKTPIQQRVNQKEKIDSLYIRDCILHMPFFFSLHVCYHCFCADVKSFLNCQVWRDMSLRIKLNKQTATVNTYCTPHKLKKKKGNSKPMQQLENQLQVKKHTFVQFKEGTIYKHFCISFFLFSFFLYWLSLGN